jgi:poly-gamma-glutamate capsule biosynthesis protein CapA/YwtB (metallophosphatase superfamily)
MLPRRGRSAAFVVAAATVAVPVLLVACTAPVAQPPPAAPAVSDVAEASATASPTATTGAPASRGPRGTLVVHGTGDVNLDPSYIPALHSRGYAYAWTGLDGLFTGDDLTVVNLECPVSDRGAIVPKEFNFRCDPAALPAAKAAGVEVANLANNHSGDFGPDALLDSVERLRANDIAPVGAGANLRAASTAAVVERDGWRIAVLGFGGVVPAGDWLAGPSRPGMASGDDTAAMVTAVRAAGEVADLVFVTIHWGVELDTQPRADDVARAHAMIDAGADGVFGHHSHRLQPLSSYKGRPIAWGLGNFVWPALSDAGSRSAVAEFVVTPDGAVSGCLLPVRITSPGHPELVGARSCVT